MSNERQSPGTVKIRKVWDDYIAKRILDQEVKKFNIDAYLADVICPGPFYYYIIDFSDRSIPFISKELHSILGIAAADYSVEKFFEILHPDDVPFMAACEEKVCDFLYNEIPPEKMLKYKFTYKFRLKAAGGNFRHILHQAIAISIDKEGQLHQVMGIHTDISHITKANERRLSIIGLQGEPSYFSVDPLQEGFKSTPNEDHFSPQEKKIIGLMAEGLTTTEVAAILHISKETVATHRKNILRKSGCKNTIEVIVKAIKEGVI